MENHVMKTISLLLCCACLLIACEEDDRIDAGSNSYLPLEVGNLWIFRSMQPDVNNNKNFRKVIAEANLDNRIYAQVISGWYDPEEVVNDTVYYRVDDNGFVYSRRKFPNTEVNIFRLNEQDGAAWTSPYLDSSTLSVNLSVVNLEIRRKTLRNCKAYFYDVNRWADEEYTVTLAKGVGFVKEYSNAWGLGDILESATINGRKFNF
jgi:hypothetical protein